MKAEKALKRNIQFFKAYRMTTGPLFIVVDEDVVPGEGAHVESVECAEDPKEGGEDEGGQEDMEAPGQAAAALLFLLLDLLLDLGQPVAVHLQLHVKDLTFILAPLYRPRHCQEACRVLDQEALLVGALQDALPKCHVDTRSSYTLVSHVVRAQNLHCFIICIYPEK